MSMKVMQTILVLVMLGLLGFTSYHVFQREPTTDQYVGLGMLAIGIIFGLYTLHHVIKNEKRHKHLNLRD